MQEHYTYECLRESYDCPFCTKDLPREEFESHNCEKTHWLAYLGTKARITEDRIILPTNQQVIPSSTKKCYQCGGLLRNPMSCSKCIIVELCIGCA